MASKTNGILYKQRDKVETEAKCSTVCWRSRKINKEREEGSVCSELEEHRYRQAILRSLSSCLIKQITLIQIGCFVSL